MIIVMYELVEKTNKVAAIANKSISEQILFDQIINLLEVIIWPLTVFGGLLLFRKHFSKLISSLGSIKAGTQGFEMNFIEDKLQEATKLIGMGSSDFIPKEGITITPKQGGAIIPKDGGSIIPKSNKDIIQQKSQAASPYQELIVLQDAINQKLKNKAQQNSLDTSSTSNFALTSKLENNNLIDRHTALKLKTLIELNTLGLNSPKINYEQVTQMKKLFNNISI